MRKYSNVIIAVAFCAAFALYLNFTGIVARVNADAIVTYFVSLVKWTPFFWGQDRFGMILPLIALPVHDPLINVVLQNSLHMFFIFMGLFLAAYYLTGKRNWLATGALSVLALFALSDDTTLLLEFLFPSQLYSNAIFFGWLSLIAAPHSFGLALIAALIANWCNFVIGPFFLSLVLALVAFNHRGWRAWRQGLWDRKREILIFLLAIVAGQILRSRFETYESQGYSLTTLAEIFQGLMDIFVNKMTRSPAQFYVPPILLALAILITRKKPDLRIYSAVFCQSILFTFATCASQMAKWTGFPARYLIPMVLLWIPVNIGLTLNLIEQRWTRIRPALITAASTLILATLLALRWGLPSQEALEDGLEAGLAPAGAEALRLKCTHVVGDYYNMWHAMLYAWLRGHEIWAVGNRTSVMESLYSGDRIPNARICLWKANLKDSSAYINLAPLTLKEQSETMLVYVPPGH